MHIQKDRDDMNLSLWKTRFTADHLERYRLQDMILTENLLSRLFRGKVCKFNDLDSVKSLVNEKTCAII